MTSAVTGMLDALIIANAFSTRPDLCTAPGVRFEAKLLGMNGTVTGSSGIQLPVAPVDHAAAQDALIVPPMLADIDGTLGAHSHQTSDSRGLLRYAPQAAWQEIPNTGHHLELENAPAVAQAVDTWLRQDTQVVTA